MNYSKSSLQIPNATIEAKDAAQYMLYKGRKQYNLCGEFCVAYCMGDAAYTNNIDDFLNYWEAKDQKFFQSLFHNGLARTTSIYDLQKMLAAYGYGEHYPLPQILTSIKVDPVAFRSFLTLHQLIVGVKIDNYGYLVGSGIPHWVVLDDIEYVDANHSICKIYNPYTNNEEPYTWRELMTSTGAYKQGIWIER